MVTTQDVGSDGEFQTRYYKVSFDYTPDIRSMWGYIVFAFLFVRLFVRTYVHSYIRLSFHHRVKLCVKVYKTSYFEDPLMDFIHIWHDGRYRSKVFISIIPNPGVTLGLRSWKSQDQSFCVKFIRPHILKTLWWISFIFGMMVDIGLKFLSAPSPPRGWPWGQGHGLRIFIKKSGSKFLC